jgi:hypothetical protein
MSPEQLREVWAMLDRDYLAQVAPQGAGADLRDDQRRASLRLRLAGQ